MTSLGIALVLLITAVAAAQHPADQGGAPTRPRIKSVRMGFDGRYKVGCWTPIAITVTGGDSQFVGSLYLETQDGDGEATRISSLSAVPDGAPAGAGDSALLEPPIIVPAGGEVTLIRHIKIGRLHDPEVVVVLEGRGGLVVRKRLTSSAERGDETFLYPLDVSSELIVSVGPGIGIQQGNPSSDGPISAARSLLVNLDDVGALPTRWYGYEGVDVVVLTTSLAEIYRELQENRRLEALETWVRHGGRLILCVGAQAPEVLAPDHPLARFAPGKYVESVTLRETSALESFAQQPPVAWTTGPSVPRLEGIRGKIEIEDTQTRLPLAVRSAYGWGEVLFVALDLDRPPLNRWSGQAAFLNRLLQRSRAAVTEEPPPFGGPTGTIGYTDVSGQLRAALDHFDGIRTVSFSLVALLVAAYIVLIGPVDYFLVKKVLKRPELTWVTFPTMVVLVSAAAYALANYFKGDQLRVNQFDVVDLDDASGQVRGTTCLQVFSPQPDTYSLALEARLFGNEARPETVLSWFGLPGEAMGGMGARTVATLFQRPYLIAPDAGAMRHVPIQVWSTKAFTARWRMTAAGHLQSNLEAERGAIRRRVSGTVVNPFDVPLSDCCLYYGEAVYPLGDMPPAASVAIDARRESIAATTRLTRAARVQEKDLQISVATPYRREELDVDRIADALFFYRLAGGDGFADGLRNDYLSFLDASRLLDAGQAVLVGKGPERYSAARVLRDGEPIGSPQDRRWTYYRVVIGVGDSESGARGR